MSELLEGLGRRIRLGMVGGGGPANFLFSFFASSESTFHFAKSSSFFSSRGSKRRFSSSLIRPAFTDASAGTSNATG